MAEDLETLKARIKELEEILAQQNDTQPARSKIDKMSSEVVDSNPYRSVKCLENVSMYVRSTPMKKKLKVLGFKAITIIY